MPGPRLGEVRLLLVVQPPHRLGEKVAIAQPRYGALKRRTIVVQRNGVDLLSRAFHFGLQGVFDEPILSPGGRSDIARLAHGMATLAEWIGLPLK